MASIREQFRQIKPVNFFFLTLAGIINAVGVTLFLAPEAVREIEPVPASSEHSQPVIRRA